MSDQDGMRSRRGLGTAVPVLVFLGLATAFLIALYSGDPSRLPSALIGRPVPAFTLPAVPELRDASGPVAGFGHTDLARGEVTIVNVWASWCAPCRDEHPLLMQLKDIAPIYGINHKDPAADARRFLATHGNPFTRVGADSRGRVSIDWGVYGVPETFVVDGTGRIAFKHVGPISEQTLNEQLLPAVRRAQAQGH